MLSRRQTNQAALGTVVAVFNVSARACVRACACVMCKFSSILTLMLLST